jgi:hypothetical protein
MVSKAVRQLQRIHEIQWIPALQMVVAGKMVDNRFRNLPLRVMIAVGLVGHRQQLR